LIACRTAQPAARLPAASGISPLVKFQLPTEMSRQSLEDRDRLELLIIDKPNVLMPIKVSR
jgi:hypothetical protein